MVARCLLSAASKLALQAPESISPSSPKYGGDNRMGSCLGLTRAGGRRGWFYDVVVLLPALGFTLFLLMRARSSVQKLLHSRSLIMGTYYAFLWIISILNICWCVLEMLQDNVTAPTTSWNVMSLITRFGLVLLEVSVVIFLSQGYLTSTWDALTRTLIFSGLISAIDALIKAFYIFKLGIPLFVIGDEKGVGKKWGFWFVHSSLFAGVYLLILILPFTKWRDKLPARPAFYNYVLVLFVLNASDVLGCLLLLFGADFGYCIYSFTNYAYYAFYPPLLYVTFLADFFKEETFQLEDVYYSEMKDAGYFDADWD